MVSIYSAAITPKHAGTPCLGEIYIQAKNFSLIKHWIYMSFMLLGKDWLTYIMVKWLEGDLCSINFKEIVWDNILPPTSKYPGDSNEDLLEGWNPNADIVTGHFKWELLKHLRTCPTRSYHLIEY